NVFLGRVWLARRTDAIATILYNTFATVWPTRVVCQAMSSSSRIRKDGKARDDTKWCRHTPLRILRGRQQQVLGIAVSGGEVTVRFGRIGTNGQTQTKKFPDPAA